MQALVQQTRLDVWSMPRFGQTKDMLKRIFGCWHLEMSLPFTRDGETYRTCVVCGARRRFDLERWMTVGPFYREDGQPTLHGSKLLRITHSPRKAVAKEDMQ